MLLLERGPGELVDASAPLTLEEYLALPDDTRCEIVDGILRPMPRSSSDARGVQEQLAGILKTLTPPDLRVRTEEIVVFQVTPPDTRIPDVVVFPYPSGVRKRTNHTAAKEVVLAVEVVSPGSESEDRYVKPGQYARNGIPYFWRIELEPDVAVHTFAIRSGEYVDTGVFRRGERIVSAGLPWVSVPVDQLPDWD